MLSMLQGLDHSPSVDMCRLLSLSLLFKGGAVGSPAMYIQILVEFLLLLFLI